ncbi:MAG: hypothetical protein ABI446_05420 [Gemmatimonadaceae bacterium]
MRGGIRAESYDSRLSVVLSVVAGWAIGIALQFYPTLVSGFSRVQGDRADARLNNYILEHGYRWLTGMPGHERFWSPPVFYPVANTAAYSDVLLGVAPLYWPLRLAGLAPDSAFQSWMLALATLNFASAFILFWRGFRCRPLASAVGAVVLSFAAMRTSQVMHAQLIAHCYIVLAIFALLRVFEPEPELRAGVTIVERRTVWIFALAAACVAQLYSSFYYGWFLCFALLIAALWSLVLPGARRRLVLAARTNARALGAATALGALALAPLATHYLSAEREIGARSFAMVEPLLPRVESWAYLGSHSWLYGWLASNEIFRALPLEHEHRLGIGVATALLAAFGLWRARRRPSVQWMVLVPLTMAVLATEWPGGFTLWRAVYLVVPGADALRAVSRIAVAILFPASLGVALLINAISRARRVPPSRAAVQIRRRDQRRRALAVVAIIAVVVAEQVTHPRSYDKLEARERVASVAAGIGASCDAFLYSTIGGDDDPWSYQADAMWASMEHGVPTINGYSGGEPPGWSFEDIRVRSAEQESVIVVALARWEERRKLVAARVCRVRTPG